MGGAAVPAMTAAATTTEGGEAARGAAAGAGGVAGWAAGRAARAEDPHRAAADATAGEAAGAAAAAGGAVRAVLDAMQGRGASVVVGTEGAAPAAPAGVVGGAGEAEAAADGDRVEYASGSWTEGGRLSRHAPPPTCRFPYRFPYLASPPSLRGAAPVGCSPRAPCARAAAAWRKAAASAFGVSAGEHRAAEAQVRAGAVVQGAGGPGGRHERRVDRRRRGLPCPPPSLPFPLPLPVLYCGFVPCPLHK